VEEEHMGKASLLISIISGAVSLTRLMGDLAVIYLGLGWKVRKARRALEKELMKNGMSKEDARKIGAQYAALKDNTIYAIKRSIFRFHF
jgi:hypothetical protein